MKTIANFGSLGDMLTFNISKLKLITSSNLSDTKLSSSFYKSSEMKLLSLAPPPFVTSF